MRGLGHDLRYALRMLGKAPGTSVAVLLSLALGIGANAAIFSIVNALLLRPLPVRAPTEMAAVFTSDYGGPAYGSSSYPDYLAYRDATPALAALAAHNLQAVGLSGREQSARLWAEVVSGNYFETIGVGALHGRLLAPADDAAGPPSRC